MRVRRVWKEDSRYTVATIELVAFQEILPLKSEEARMCYAKDAAERNYGVRELRHQISRKAYECREIASTELSAQSAVPFNVFKDPYLLDILGLKESYLEVDLENAILTSASSSVLPQTARQ
jgi:predicted nuclease of restriction endonuclease-like (RecB) superfamily